MGVMEQRSEEWFKIKAGRLSGTRFKIIKTGTPHAQSKLMEDLRWEIENGTCRDKINGTPAPIMWGRTQEPIAKQHFELITMVDIREEAFIIHPHLDYVGISPDGLIDPDSGIEIKCPWNQTNHIAAFDSMPDEHIPQVQGAMWVTGRPQWWFLSFDPRFPIKEKQLIRHLILRDQSYIDDLSSKCEDFWARFTAGVEPAQQEIDPADMLSQIPNF